MKFASTVVLALVALPLVLGGIVYAEDCPKDKNVNTCAKSVLTAIKGIGDKTADKIIEGRPYTSLSDMTRVKRIGPKTVERFREAGLCAAPVEKD